MRTTTTGRASYTSAELVSMITSLERTATALSRAVVALAGNVPAHAPALVASAPAPVATSVPGVTFTPAPADVAPGRAIRPSDGKLGFTCTVSADCGAITKGAKSAAGHGAPGATGNPESWHQYRPSGIQAGREVR